MGLIGKGGVSSIWARTKSHLRMTGSHVTGSDDSLVNGRGHVRKYVMRMRNRKLRNIRRSKAFSPEVTLRDRKSRYVTVSHVTGRGPVWNRTWSRAHSQPLHVVLLLELVVQNVIQVPWLPKITWPLRGSLGCAHAQPEVAQYPPLFTGSWLQEVRVSRA